MVVRWPRLLNPTQLSQIIKHQKNPLTALQIFNEANVKFPNYRHNGVVYATMINILGNSNRFDEMKQVIEMMKHDSCECKDAMFAGIFKLYAKAGLLNDAVSLYKTLNQFNCVNWTASFNTLLQIMLKESKLENFYHLLMEESSLNGWAIKSRIGSLNMLMDALCQIRRSDLALQVFQEMGRHCCFPDRESYKILMNGLCRECKLDDATHLLYAMLWRISQKGCGDDIVVYRTLLDHLCENGKVNMAIDVLGKILRKGLRAPKSRCKIVDLDQLHDTCDIERAKVLINEALVKGTIPSSASYTSVATDFYSEGKISSANKVLNEMQKRGFHPSLKLFKAKVISLCKEGRVNEASTVIEEEMLKNECLPNSKVYTLVIKEYINQGKSDLAMKFLEKGSKPNKETLSVIIDGLCKDGRFTEASKITEKMLRKSFWPEPETFTVLIKGLCSTGRVYEGVVWLEEMISQAKLPDSDMWAVLVTSVCCNHRKCDTVAFDTILANELESK